MSKFIAVLLILLLHFTSHSQNEVNYAYTIHSSYDYEGIISHIEFDTISSDFTFDITSNTIAISPFISSKKDGFSSKLVKDHLSTFIEVLLNAEECLIDNASLRTYTYEAIKSHSTRISKFDRRKDSSIIDFVLTPTSAYPLKCNMKGYINQELNEIKAVYKKYTDVNALGYYTHSVIHIWNKD